MTSSPSDFEHQFAEAYEQYSDAIFRHCYFRVYSRERGRELMQETFVKAWQYAEKGNTIDQMQAFLYRIANNLIIDEARRRKKRQVRSLEDMQELGIEPVSVDETKLMKTKVDNSLVLSTLEKVEEPYRTAIVMRYIDELSPAEIADVTGETANVVSVRINRGLKKLRSLLKE